MASEATNAPAGGRPAAAHAKARRVVRRLGRWTFLASMDARDRLAGRRDALVPPRRLQLAGWRADFHTTGEHWLRTLIEVGGLRPDHRVVDVGCGPGRIAVALTRFLDRGSYEGFDIVPDSVRWCQRRITPRHPRFRFQLADVYNASYNPAGGQAASTFRFPFPDRCFDVGLATSVFTHMPPAETHQYLQEASRVLRPGGRMLSTFFLLNESSERFLVEDEWLGGLEHELTDDGGRRYRASSRITPERRIALWQPDAERMHAEAGLHVDLVQLGSWAGRPDAPRRQDLIVARKPRFRSGT